MSDFQFPKASQEVQKVDVIHLDHSIGQGQLIQTGMAVEISGSYVWPPDVIAETPFRFDLKLLSPTACSVRVDWPVLLDETIDDPHASYVPFMVLGRLCPRVTAGRNEIAVNYTGPINNPLDVTGVQISVTEPKSAAVLTFRFRR